VIGFLKEQFVPKGDVSGFLRYALIPLFLFVGVIELIFDRDSTGFRCLFGYFGNIYAGETLLHTMQTIGSGLPFGLGFLTSVLFPLPFYFLELLVGLLQAFVFAMLCAVYIKLSTGSEEGEHGPLTTFSVETMLRVGGGEQKAKPIENKEKREIMLEILPMLAADTAAGPSFWANATIGLRRPGCRLSAVGFFVEGRRPKQSVATRALLVIFW